jgi:hypothetical protein
MKASIQELLLREGFRSWNYLVRERIPTSLADGLSLLFSHRRHLEIMRLNNAGFQCADLRFEVRVDAMIPIVFAGIIILLLFRQAQHASFLQYTFPR